MECYKKEGMQSLICAKFKEICKIIYYTISLSPVFQLPTWSHSLMLCEIIVSILDPCFNKREALQVITHLQSLFELVYSIPAWIKALFICTPNEKWNELRGESGKDGNGEASKEIKSWIGKEEWTRVGGPDLITYEVNEDAIGNNSLCVWVGVFVLG